MRILAVAFTTIALTLAGCTSAPIRLYEGAPRAAQEVAVLQVGEPVVLISVDGRDVPALLLAGAKQQVEVLPGERVLAVRYSQLWDLSASEHEVVRSKPVAVRFQAQPGAIYQFRFPAPKNVEQARRFAKAPAFELVQVGGAKVAESVAIKSFGEASLIDSLFQPEGGAKAATTDLDLLKDVWNRSSAETRDAFRRWVEQGSQP